MSYRYHTEGNTLRATWYDDDDFIVEDWSDYNRRRSFWGIVAVVVAVGLFLGFPFLLAMGAK